MLALRFYQLQYNSALFFNKKRIYVTIYINDLQIIGLDLIVNENLKTNLSQKFNMIYLSPILHYFDMVINISEVEIVIMQKTYVEKLLNSLQMSNFNFWPTSLAEKLNLEPMKPEFTRDATNVTVYKKFTGSI